MLATQSVGSIARKRLAVVARVDEVLARVDEVLARTAGPKDPIIEDQRGESTLGFFVRAYPSLLGTEAGGVVLRLRGRKTRVRRRDAYSHLARIRTGLQKRADFKPQIAELLDRNPDALLPNLERIVSDGSEAMRHLNTIYKQEAPAP